MHIETLKVFCDVVETGSFSVAASQNFITQSAVSQQLRALEAKYRCKLLERSRGGAKPTPQGAILVNTGRGKYAWVTILPMLWVMSTTLTAGTQLVTVRFPAMIEAGKKAAGVLNMALTLFVMASVLTLVFWAAARWVAVWSGGVPTRAE